MNRIRETVKDYIIITLATVIVAAATYFFLIPAHISVGGISGLAIVLSNFVPFPISAISLFFNVALLIVGFLFVGREFGTKTVYISILMPLMLGVLERIFPHYTSVMGDPFLDMICYVFMVNIGVAILFSHNASSGGIDIVAKLLNKVFHMDIGTGVAICGFIIALSSVVVYDRRTVIISLLGTYFNGAVLDRYIFGFNIKKRVCIISEKEKTIKEFIVQTLHSGATVYEVLGAYNAKPRKEIITIVDKNEYQKLMSYIEKTDGNAFVTVYNVNKIMCRPKSKPVHLGGSYE